jgi:choline dehydrogenase-like flavoprotein
MSSAYDVIVIGSGAGGGTLVRRLAPSGTSFFPSIGAVNPALTAMANAVRVGDRILERLGAPAARPEPAHVA